MALVMMMRREVGSFIVARDCRPSGWFLAGYSTLLRHVGNNLHVFLCYRLTVLEIIC